MKRWFVILAATLTCAAEGAPQVGLIKIEGAIGPATATYISRAIEISAGRKDECLIIQLDTPGGLLESTKHIVQHFYASRVPTVVYVAPAPASAGSAGVFITMAADVAAMAPHTSIGAAHPVALGGLGGGEEKKDDVMKEKMENYASSFIEGIADKRKRNAEWARSAVVKSAAITAEKALELNVIDLIAADIPDLLKQLDGREVGALGSAPSGDKPGASSTLKTLRTAGAQVLEIPMTVREKFLHFFLRPEVMFVLVLMVIYGIIGELSNPGAILPGVVGAIALILVLYMSAILPVNAAGLALIGLALALFVVDIYASTHGVLTAGGIVSFFLGALMLFDKAEPGFRLSLGYIVPGVIVTALFFIFIVGAGLRAQRLPVRAGSETMLGQVVNAISRIDASGGRVFVEGEYWNAVSDGAVEAGQPVEIVAVNGLTLKVRAVKA